MLKVNTLKFEILGKVKFINVKVNLSYKTPDFAFLRQAPPPHFKTDEILSGKDSTHSIN